MEHLLLVHIFQCVEELQHDFVDDVLLGVLLHVDEIVQGAAVHIFHIIIRAFGVLALTVKMHHARIFEAVSCIKLLVKEVDVLTIVSILGLDALDDYLAATKVQCAVNVAHRALFVEFFDFGKFACVGSRCGRGCIFGNESLSAFAVLRRVRVVLHDKTRTRRFWLHHKTRTEVCGIIVI